MTWQVKRVEIVLELFNHREARDPSDPEKGPLRVKTGTGAGPCPFTSGSNSTLGLLFCHDSSP